MKTVRNQLEPNQEIMAYDTQWRCLYLLKTVALEAKNVLACCHGEESMSDLSKTLLPCLMASISLFNTM
jgi:hypothetical protein